MTYNIRCLAMVSCNTSDTRLSGDNCVLWIPKNRCSVVPLTSDAAIPVVAVTANVFPAASRLRHKFLSSRDFPEPSKQAIPDLVKSNVRKADFMSEYMSCMTTNTNLIHYFKKIL